ncbi:MAG: hypothetical protein LBT97_00640 [Planctomycetota bacterium]|nr:hypothetical protein [Planctomycetota bacterium]
MGKTLLLILLFLHPLVAAGCSDPGANRDGAGLSLVEIGERALENGERQADSGRVVEARESYRRALWAFRYHKRLTGEQPLLMDEAIEASKRFSKAR